MEKFLSRADLSLRLNGTLCLWDGEPVKVLVEEDFSSDTDIRISFFNGKTRPKTVDYTCGRLTCDGIKLGYVNIHDACYFVARLPVRRNTMSLSQNSISVSNGGSRTILFTSEMRNTILGIYPEFKDAIVTVENRYSIAISRDFALQRENNLKYLHYRDTRVGILNRDATFQIFDAPNASFIRRALDKQGF